MPLPKDNNLKPGDTFDFEEGELYSICTCGFSKKRPFCDGAHKIEAPECKSMKVEIKRAGFTKIY